MDGRFPTHWRDYALLDAGKRWSGRRSHGGSSRPFAIWPPAGDPRTWKQADATFEPTGRTHGKWRAAPGTPNGGRFGKSEALDLAFELR